jgi:hypothetical protein
MVGFDHGIVTALGGLRISANVTGDFGNVIGLRSDAELRREDCRDGVFLGWFYWLLKRDA